MFLLVTILLSAGILTNLTFKSYWGRPRPVVVTRIQRALAVRAVVGSARQLRAQLLVLLRRGRHRVLDLCARGADAAGLAAAGLCRGDPVRRRHQRRCGWRSAGISSPTSRPPGLVTLPGDLAGLCADLPLAVDPAVGRADRRRADALGLAAATGCGSAGAGAMSARSGPVDFIAPGAIKRVPISAKFDIRARQAANDIRHFDRLEAP